jgi:hypothetical protein
MKIEWESDINYHALLNDPLRTVVFLTLRDLYTAATTLRKLVEPLLRAMEVEIFLTFIALNMAAVTLRMEVELFPILRALYTAAVILRMEGELFPTLKALYRAAVTLRKEELFPTWRALYKADATLRRVVEPFLTLWALYTSAVALRRVVEPFLILWGLYSATHDLKGIGTWFWQSYTAGNVVHGPPEQVNVPAEALYADGPHPEQLQIIPLIVLSNMVYFMTQQAMCTGLK